MVYWCNACEYGHIWKRPEAVNIAQFYELDHYYTHERGNLTQGGEVPSFVDRLRENISWRLDRGESLDTEKIKGCLTRTPRPTICEIGCGNGDNLRSFRDAGFDVVGVEPDKSARKLAKQTIETVYEGTAESLPEEVSCRRFDVVLMSHVLEHCLEINQTLQNARNILKETGLLIIEVPNCRSLGYELYQETWPWTDIPRHLNFFTPNSLRSVCRKYGFHISSTEYTGFSRQFSNPWLKTEEEIWRILNEKAGPSRPPDFKKRSWKLLIRSLFIARERKYDSVRILAVK
jgi:SAM-dependent methyltransferase